MKASFFILITIKILFFSTALSAQVEVLVMNSSTIDQNDKPSESKAYIHDHKVLVETSGQQSGSTMLFDAEKETFYIMDHKKKEYTEMTRQDMEALSNMVNEQMKMLEQQLANLPEAQREMARKQMSAAFDNQSGLQAVEFEKEASGIMVENWKTDKYVGRSDGQKKSEIYLASFQELGQDKKDFQAMEKFFSLMQDFAKSMNRNLPSTSFAFFGENLPAFKEGIPAKTIIYDDKGEAISTSTIHSIDEEKVDEGLFSIPENYEKKQMRKAFME